LCHPLFPTSTPSEVQNCLGHLHTQSPDIREILHDPSYQGFCFDLQGSISPSCFGQITAPVPSQNNPHSALHLAQDAGTWRRTRSHSRRQCCTRNQGSGQDSIRRTFLYGSAMKDQNGASPSAAPPSSSDVFGPHPVSPPAQTGALSGSDDCRPSTVRA